MKSRPLDQTLLDEFNEYFSSRRAYPAALLAAALASATAVLGYGPNIGVPIQVHWSLGILTLVINAYAIWTGVQSLRENQRILDRACEDLDRLDREIGPAPAEAGEVDWRYGSTTRWVIFSLAAWLPFLYWGVVAWRGDFGRVPTLLPIGTAIASGLALRAAWRSAR